MKGASATVLALFLTFLLTAAGCVKAPAASPAATKTTPPSFVDAGTGTGSIAGKVNDDEGRPVEAVEIQIANRTNSTSPISTLSTDASGRFIALGLAGGTYTLYARKFGFEDVAPKAVNVVEGEETNVTFVLQPLPQIVPMHKTTQSSHGFTNTVCLVVTGVATLCGVNIYAGGGAPKAVEVDESKTGELQTFLLELRWTSEFPACPGYYRGDVYSPDQGALDPNFPRAADYREDNPYHWDNIPESFKTPTRTVAQRHGDPLGMLSGNRTELNGGEEIATSGKWQYQVEFYKAGAAHEQTAGVYCVVQQTINAAATVFYVEPMPKHDWSFFKP